MIKLTRRDRLIDAMTALRGIRDIGQKQCRDGIYAGVNPFEYQEKLFQMSYALTASAYNIPLANEHAKLRALI